MATPQLFWEHSMRPTDTEIAAAVEQFGGQRAAARELGIPRTTIQEALKRISSPAAPRDGEFEVAEVPTELAPIEDIIKRRVEAFQRKSEAHEARKLVPVQINVDGPIGIMHMGDPHIDDDGCDFPMLLRHIDIVNTTPGMFAGTVGDVTNNWVGRLAALYANQGTTIHEAHALVEWFVKAIRWLYIVGGNHDAWSGANDVLAWLMRQQPGLHQNHGVRLGLKFPNGREIRINARHDFKGHSQWNTAHGAAKAAMMGWRDHVLTCGHTHTSGYNVLKDPSSGLISHALRVAAYKTVDEYAEKCGFPDGDIFCAPVTIINPYATDERRLVHVVFDPEEGADFLTWQRKRWEAGRAL